MTIVDLLFYAGVGVFLNLVGINVMDHPVKFLLLAGLIDGLYIFIKKS